MRLHEDAARDSAVPSEVLLIRHCEAVGSAPDAALTEHGRAQAAELAVLLDAQAVDALVSSPYRRARDSAEPLALRARLSLELEPRLREWELPWIAPEQWPDALRPILRGESALPREVETLAAARARGLAVLREALARHRRCALVTHGKLLALVLAELQGRDPFDVFVELRNPHVFAVRGDASHGAVRSLWSP